MLSKKQLQEIGNRANAATVGPWTSSREDMDSYVDFEEESTPVAYIYRAPEERIGVLGNQFRNDSRFIANARQDIPALLAVIAEQAAKIGLLQAAVEFYADAETWRQHVRETRKGRNSHWDLKPIKLDKGNRARAALTSIAEGEQKEE